MLVYFLESVLALFVARVLFYSYIDHKRTNKNSTAVAVKTIAYILGFFAMCGIMLVLFAALLFHLKRPSPEVWKDLTPQTQYSPQTR
jgi:hypothetical protein